MRCVGRHLHSLLLSLCILSSLASAADFSGCYPSERLDRFWLSQDYAAQNPLIMRFLAFNIYAFPFSGSLESLGLERAQVMPGEDFLRSLPENGKGFEGVATNLDSASSSLHCAKQSLSNAQYLASSAKSAIETSFGITAIGQDGLVYGGLAAPALRVADFASYAYGFEYEYFATLGCTADAFDSVNDAGRAACAKAQSEYARLGLAGAGSDAYSGSAKEPYLYARSLLFSGGACEKANLSSETILSNFRQSQNLPDYSGAGVADYLNSAAGGTNSSIYRIASLSSSLSSAYAGMELEYQTALLQAKSSEKRLAEEASSLSREELSLIGDLPSSSEPAGTITVGMGYGGIESAWKQSSNDLGKAQDEIALAESASKSRTENYLATAILRANAAHTIASNALAAAGAARADAASAAAARKISAQSAILRAEGAKAASSPGSLSSQEAYRAASGLLDKAKEEFSSAERTTSLGRRYYGFAKAEGLADQSYREFSGEERYAESADAMRAVEALERLAKAAQKDGLDASYELGRVEQYQSLLSSAYTQELAAAVFDSAQDDYDSLALRIYEQYSPLEGEYMGAVSLSGALSSAGAGVDCGLDGIAPLFPSGRLDAAFGAGKLAAAKDALGRCREEFKKRMPAALSAILEKNSHVDELSETPVLGSPTLYQAAIYTSNPTSLSYNGKVGFLAATSNPLYSSEIFGSPLPADAYPESGKTRIILDGVLPGSSFHFSFKKTVQAAQRTGAYDTCLQASQLSASMRREISFFATMQLPELMVSEPAPPLSRFGKLSYNGNMVPAEAFEGETQSSLSASIANIPQGKGSLSLDYSVPFPFEASASEISFESLPLGARRGAMLIDVSGSKIDCASSEVEIYLPYSSPSNISLSCTQGCSGSLSFTRESWQNSTTLRAKLPVAKGTAKRIAAYFTLEDPSAALSEALFLAEQQLAAFNRTSDALLLADARALAAANRTSDALAILSKMRQGAAELSLIRADFALYSEERSALSESLSSLSSLRDYLLLENSTEAAAIISSPLSKCLASAEAADSDAKSEPIKALSSLRKAKTALFSSLAESSWDYISGISSSAAKAAKTSKPGSLGRAWQLLSEAERLYAQGEFAQALAPASEASKALAEAALQDSYAQSNASSTAEALRQEYAVLRNSTGQLLISYSAQYSAISAQGKKKLPITPSEAEKAISDADKGIAASQKQSASQQEQLALADSSFQKLKSTADILSGSMDSLKQSASSSLAVARAALAEAKAKVGISKKQDVENMENEVQSASELLASGQYGESIASSDRAIKAANAALSGASSQIDTKALLLGAVSLVFIAAAAYYFLRGKKPIAPQEKKEVKKAGQIGLPQGENPGSGA